MKEAYASREPGFKNCFQQGWAQAQLSRESSSSKHLPPLFLPLFDLVLKFRDRKGGLKFLSFKEGVEETFNPNGAAVQIRQQPLSTSPALLRRGGKQKRSFSRKGQ